MRRSRRKTEPCGDTPSPRPRSSAGVAYRRWSRRRFAARRSPPASEPWTPRACMSTAGIRKAEPGARRPRGRFSSMSSGLAAQAHDHLALSSIPDDAKAHLIARPEVVEASHDVVVVADGLALDGDDHIVRRKARLIGRGAPVYIPHQHAVGGWQLERLRDARRDPGHAQSRVNRAVHGARRPKFVDDAHDAVGRDGESDAHGPA